MVAPVAFALHAITAGSLLALLYRWVPLGSPPQAWPHRVVRLVKGSKYNRE